MEIVDNFVNEIFRNELKQTICSSSYIWNYCNSGTQLEYDKKYHFMDDKTIDSPQFTHDLSGDEYVTKYLLYCIEDYFGRSFSDRLVRAKVNMLLKDSSYINGNYHIPHSDYTDASESVIYYVNDSDGDTFIFNEKPNIDLREISIKTRVSPIKGRLILFNSSYLHASSSPIINRERIVINLVFKVNK